MIARLAVACFLAWVLVRDTHAQSQSVPSDTLLAGISERGRLLAGYDQAAWHASDALQALPPDGTRFNTMLALRSPDGRWRVLWGRLTEGKDTFHVVYEATPTVQPDSFAIRTHTPALALTGAEPLAATALHAALSDFDPKGRPYNSYVLPRPDGGFWVYFMPAQTDLDAFPHGADVRYLMSPDGRRIVKKHAMHNSLLNLALPEKAVAGAHSVVVDDVPQDSDVFLVLARQPRRPELIATDHNDYEIAVNGVITWRRGKRTPDG